MIGQLSTLNMQTPDSSPITPKKRAPVKRTKEQLWSVLPSKLSHIPPDLENMQQAVKQLQERVHSLETEWECLLEHLSEQEDITDCTTDEEEMN